MTAVEHQLSDICRELMALSSLLKLNGKDDSNECVSRKNTTESVRKRRNLF